jgi:hypothetical protein
MGIAVSGLLMLTNLREIFNWAEVGPARWIGYVGIPVVCLVCGLAPAHRARRATAAAAR